MVIGQEGQVTQFLLHESSSWVEIRLHSEFGRVWLCRSGEKVTDGCGCGVVRGFA